MVRKQCFYDHNGNFDVGQNVVNRAAGVINQQTAINIDSVITSMETAMESMEVGELIILALETLLASLCLKVISVFITVILYGRMIEIYLYSSIGAIPFATMSNREWGQISSNYLRGLFALAFQGFLSWYAWAFILCWLQTYRYPTMCIRHCSV